MPYISRILIDRHVIIVEYQDERFIGYQARGTNPAGTYSNVEPDRL